MWYHAVPTLVVPSCCGLCDNPDFHVVSPHKRMHFAHRNKLHSQATLLFCVVRACVYVARERACGHVGTFGFSWVLKVWA